MMSSAKFDINNDIYSITADNKFAKFLDYMSALSNTFIKNRQADSLLSMIYPHYFIIADIPIGCFTTVVKNGRIIMQAPSREEIDKCFELGYAKMHACLGG
jgi:hypothetical protein